MMPFLVSFSAIGCFSTYVFRLMEEFECCESSIIYQYTVYHARYRTPPWGEFSENIFSGTCLKSLLIGHPHKRKWWLWKYLAETFP